MVIDNTGFLPLLLSSEKKEVAAVFSLRRFKAQVVVWRVLLLSHHEVKKKKKCDQHRDGCMLFYMERKKPCDYSFIILYYYQQYL